jgi:hypothetical protein
MPCELGHTDERVTGPDRPLKRTARHGMLRLDRRL